MMHNGWGNVQYSLASVDAAKRTMLFERGGFQHGRGGGSGAFYVENQLELLDAPGEWYVDVKAQQVYLWPNATTSSGHVSPLRAAVLETVVVVNGTASDPVVGVTFQGLAFGETAPSENTSNLPLRVAFSNQAPACMCIQQNARVVMC